ncbi:tetratricopeptide repeat protein [Aeromonas caviae]|nr:tetratricopeptide repeat protein [Aeromonas caviae]MDX7714191.1 tetratricopeptide repeat protein [Aeromonas caviae]
MKILMGCGLLLWLGVALAQAAPLAGHELQLALQQLEESTMPVQVFRERVAALTAGQAHYPPEVQGRLARLQCWALPGERDEEFRRAVAFAEQGLAQARARKDRVTEVGLLACRGYHRQLLGSMAGAGEDYDAALTLARRLGDERQRADILSLRGEMYSYQGELAEGLMDLIDAHQRYEALGLEAKGREGLANIANAYRRMGLYERAESYFNELEHDYRQLGDEEHLVDIHSQQGLLYIDTRHRRVRQGAAPDGRSGALLSGVKAGRSTGLEPDRAGHHPAETGQAGPGHDQARSGGSLPSSRGGGGQRHPGPLAPRHGRGPRGPEPTRRGAAAPGRGRAYLYPGA